MESEVEILETDRFDCVVVNVIKNMAYQGVTVEEPYSHGRVYFGKVSADFDVQVDDVLFIGIKPLGEDKSQGSMEVYLFDEEDNKLDWTLIY
ncbi:MAG: riboflavin kinase [Methanimicrococcus sp.]|nr:riboflavin kinase [Methanimicrococcus sp.]